MLASGPHTSNPSELLNRRAFANVLERLKGQYDRILIDSPPVGVVTDAQILAIACDATVLVLRAEESSRLSTQRAREALLAVGARVVGAVVNDVSKRDTRYGYYSGYGHLYSRHGSNGHKAAHRERPAGAGPCPEKEVSSPEAKKSDDATAPVAPPSEGDPGRGVG